MVNGTGQDEVSVGCTVTCVIGSGSGYRVPWFDFNV
jgi:hypothetical protein